jgi:hypothetical protein
MDAKARRLLWNDITSLIKENRIVILTSHSMEECEALCTRLVIMVNGQFKCLGSPQHLKTKFGSGFLLTVRLNNEEYKELLLNFMRKNFPDSIVQDSHKNLFEFILPFASTKLSQVFNRLEKNRTMLDMKDYSISQTTLDQIFINFAKQQREDPFADTVLKKSQEEIYVESGRLTNDGNVSQVNYVRSPSFDFEALNQQSRRGSQSSVGSQNDISIQLGGRTAKVTNNPTGFNMNADELKIKSRRGSQSSVGSVAMQLKKNNKIADSSIKDSNNNNLHPSSSRRSSMDMTSVSGSHGIFILPLSGDMKTGNEDKPIGLFFYI